MTPEKSKEIVKEDKSGEILYKYRATGPNTAKIFTDHTLWFDKPENFNDPFDCWANVQDPDRKELEEFIDANVPPFEANVYKSGIPNYTPAMLKQDVDAALNEIGVCCFSKTEKNILMWSHYCNYHKGICLEFDVSEDPVFFDNAIPVNYVQAMPQYNHFTERDKLVEKLVQPKSTDWEYEEEVRVIKTSKDISQNGGSRAFKFKPAALKKVIFGCKASKWTITRYKNLCKANKLNNVVFTKMYQKSNGQFELEERSI